MTAVLASESDFEGSCSTSGRAWQGIDVQSVDQPGGPRCDFRPWTRISHRLGLIPETVGREGDDVALVMMETYRLKPGRMEDARAAFRDMKPALERLGATNVRVLHPEGGGERVNDLLFTWELEDWHAFATFRDAFFASPEREAMVARVMAPDAPFDHISSNFLSDIQDL